MIQQLGVVCLFAVFIYTGTIVEFAIPGTTILQTGQTIAVLCAGALLGPVFGAASVGLYVISGTLGLPIFSEGASGLAVLAGPSGGYLIGFIAAAAAIGVAKQRGFCGHFLACVGCMLVGHVIILLSGWAWMSTLIGLSEAYANGIAPFYLGSFIKSWLAAALILFVKKAVPAPFYLSKSEI